MMSRGDFQLEPPYTPHLWLCEDSNCFLPAEEKKKPAKRKEFFRHCVCACEIVGTLRLSLFLSAANPLVPRHTASGLELFFSPRLSSSSFRSFLWSSVFRFTSAPPPSLPLLPARQHQPQKQQKQWKTYRHRNGLLVREMCTR